MSSKEVSRRKFLAALCYAGGAISSLSVTGVLGQAFTRETIAAGEGKPPYSQPELEGLPQRQELEKPRVGGEKKEEVGTETQAVMESPVTPETGIELLKFLGLEGVVYIVYGRPNKYGELTWGSLGASRTAEDSWALFLRIRESISQEINVPLDKFALNVLNPVYSSVNGDLKDVYIEMALTLAPENQGLVAPNFNDINQAYETLNRFGAEFPGELLPYLAAGIDVEHSPTGQIGAREINQFSAWFAQKHHQWTGGSRIPGLVIVYTYFGEDGIGEILNLQELVQYYPHQNTLVVPIFDGYGTLGAKQNGVKRVTRGLLNSKDFPALSGVMEFVTRWEDKYDKCLIEEIFRILRGAPTKIFASQ